MQKTEKGLLWGLKSLLILACLLFTGAIFVDGKTLTVPVQVGLTVFLWLFAAGLWAAVKRSLR